MPFRRIIPALLVAAAIVLAPAGAQAALLNPLGFRLQSPALFVHEHDRAAVITISRVDSRSSASVAYRAIGLVARPGMDFTPVNGQLNFAAGESSATFDVPIVDHGLPMPPRTLSIALYGGWPTGLGVPAKALLTILNDDRPAVTLDPLNPLGLNPAPTNGDPLSGARFYLDRLFSDPAILARHVHFRHPDWAHALSVIAGQPFVQRFGLWDKPSAAVQASTYLLRAAYVSPGTVPMMATYALVEGQCARRQLIDTPAQVSRYERFIDSLARGISSYRAVLFLEMDSLITMPCLSPAGVETRLSELRYAIATLTANCPRLVIYLDAGAADAASAGRVANLLKRAGVAKIQGFFLNSTHFDWPLKEIRYGEQISRLTGGKHFVVNTGDSGQGPLAPPDPARQGNEVLCNPPGRGLGPRPTADTGYPNVDAFAWISDPGQSDGACVPGAPPVPFYWPAYAVMLVRNANYTVR